MKISKHYSHSFQPISTKLHDVYPCVGEILAIKFIGDMLIITNFMGL